MTLMTGTFLVWNSFEYIKCHTYFPTPNPPFNNSYDTTGANWKVCSNDQLVQILQSVIFTEHRITKRVSNCKSCLQSRLIYWSVTDRQIHSKIAYKTVTLVMVEISTWNMWKLFPAENPATTRYSYSICSNLSRISTNT